MSTKESIKKATPEKVKEILKAIQKNPDNYLAKSEIEKIPKISPDEPDIDVYAITNASMGQMPFVASNTRIFKDKGIIKDVTKAKYTNINIKKIREDFNISFEDAENIGDEISELIYYDKLQHDNIRILIDGIEVQPSEQTKSEVVKILEREPDLLKQETKKNKLKKQGMSYLNNDNNILKIFDSINTLPDRATKDMLNNYEYTTSEGDSFNLTGIDDAETAQELIKNYGNEIQKDILCYLLKATDTGKCNFDISNDEYFKTIGVSNQTKNKNEFLKRLKTLSSTEYTVYYEHRGNRTFVKSPIITYTRKGTWANKKNGEKELYWKSTQIELKWLQELINAKKSEVSISLIDNNIFTKVGGKNSGSNFIALYIKLEQFYRTSIQKLDNEYYHRISVKEILKNSVLNEKEINKRGYNTVIKEPLEKFLDDFYDWNFEKEIHENRDSFEKDFIRYRPKKYKTKIKYYPKILKKTTKQCKKSNLKNKKTK